ncbi:MAG TPA: 50S ribosomal protein L25 [Acidimicrobiia bacterium]|nr:50S ribosomal protein L25 [Acidimicrobiia bacterium]
MADVILTATARLEKGSRPAGRLRRSGSVPAVVYGLEADAVPVTVSERELAHILAGEGGTNTLIRLDVEGDRQLTLARQLQRHPTRGDLIHVDFVRIRRDVAVAAEVPLHAVGEAPGTRDGGLLEQLIFTLSIEAMPASIPNEIEVDVSALEIGDQIRLSEIAIPAGVALQQDPEELVVQVIMPRIVEAEEPAEEEGEEGLEGEEGEGAEASAEGDGDSDDESSD